MSTTDFFQWAARKGLSAEQIAKDLGYHFVTVYRIKSGYIQNTTNFAYRAILAYGDEVRPFFSDTLLVSTNRSRSE